MEGRYEKKAQNNRGMYSRSVITCTNRVYWVKYNFSK